MATINRITGLATGMDTESIIEKLMKAERAPLDELEKEQTKIEWQREALLEINSKMLAFRTEALDMKLQSTYKSYSATSSNSNIVTATTSSEAQEGVYKIKVTSLATQKTLTGNAIPQAITSGQINTKNATDDSVNFSGKEFKITYNGETKTIKFGANEGNLTGLSGTDAADVFYNLLQDKVNEAFGAGQIQVTVDGKRNYFTTTFTSANKLNLPVTLSGGAEGKDALSMMGITDGQSTAFDTDKTLGELINDDTAFTNDELTISINGKDFTFNKGDSIGKVFSTLSGDVDADINIRYSNSEEKVIINRDSYGAGRDLVIGGSNAFWNSIGIGTDNAFVSSHTKPGQNAVFDITAPDGESATGVSIASNNFSYGGISMTFLEAQEGETVSITVSKNVDEVYDKVKGFVDSYNDLLVTLNKYYKEKSSGYDPLTDEERESLSEKQEEQWEEKAKQGILRRDTVLQSAISSMRSAVTSYVNNSSISSLFQIGISTSTYDPVNSENNGKLVIDEAKLKQAIRDDIDGVTGLFTNVASQVQGSKIDAANMSDASIIGKSFTVTYGGKTEQITFDKGFDLTNQDGINALEEYLEGQFDSKFGEGAISFTYTNGRILFNSSKGLDLQFNSVAGNDALSLMGIRDGAKYDSSEKGFAVKIYDICTTTMNSIIDKAGSVSNIVDNSTLGQALKRKKEAVSKLEDRLEQLEERYYNQFAAMEDAISKMNSQSESLVNMLNNN